MDSWLMWRVSASLIGAGITILDKKAAPCPDAPILVRVVAFGLVSLPLVLVGLPRLGPVPPRVALASALAGALLILAAWLYYSLLARESLSRATLLMRLDSVTVLLLSVTLLGERLSLAQGASFCLGLGGGLLLLSELGQGRPRLDRSVVIVLALSMAQALGMVLLSPVYRETSVWVGLVWSGVGQLIGVLLLLLIYRQRGQIGREEQGGRWVGWGTPLVQQGVRLLIRLLDAHTIRQGLPLAVIVATSELRLLFTLLLAAWLLGEHWSRPTILPRILGMLLLLSSIWVATL